MSDEVPVNEMMDSGSPGQIPERALDTGVPQVAAGAQLAALREARGWTTAQIASQLNLANRQIQALESDNYAALPGMVIVRGFIRAYAKVLQTDPAPILAAIVDDTVAPTILLPERNALSASFSEAKLSPSGSRGFLFKFMLGVALLAVIGLALFSVQHMGWIPSSTSSQTSKIEIKLAPIDTGEVLEIPAAQPEVIETTLVPSVNESSVTNVNVAAAKPSPATPVVEAKPAVLESKPLALAPTSSKPALAAQAASIVQSDVVGASKTPVTTPLAAAVPVNSKDALAIKVREDSWVEIKRADNSVLVSRLLKAGTSEVVAVTEPVSMVIGNAAGVDVSLRGKPVDVVTGNTSNVARLNLK